MPRGTFRINTLSIPDGTFGGGGQPPVTENYWITRLGGTGNDLAYGVDADSSGNVYVTGYITDATTSQNFYIGKFDKDGAPQWQRTLGGSGADLSIGRVRVASSRNVYGAGYVSSSGQTAGSNDFSVWKYNSAGTIQWQRRLGGANSDIVFAGVALDSSENVYVAGANQSQTAGSNDITIAKWNSSGVIQYQKSYGGTGGDVPYGIDVASDGTTYLSGETTSPTLNGGASVDCYLSKLNSSGTATWQISDGLNTSNDDRFRGVKVDSAGNVFACGIINLTGQGYGILLIKYNSAGTRQWYRIVNPSTSSDQGLSMDIDSSDNIYIVGTGTADIRGIILKFDSSGNLTFSRYLGSTSTGNDQLRSIRVLNGNMYIVGDAGADSGSIGVSDIFIAKLPSDGTKTGTYTLNGSGWTYANANMTAISTGYTFSQYNRTFTETTRTLTEAATTMNSTIVAPTRHIATL